MKREALRHPKMLDLASRLKIKRTDAIGIMVALLDWTADIAPQGNIGKWPNATIAMACEWTGDPDEFIDALVTSRWVDECSVHRLVIHDLGDHLENWWKAKLIKLGVSVLSAVTICQSKSASKISSRMASKSTSENPSGTTSDIPSILLSPSLPFSTRLTPDLERGGETVASLPAPSTERPKRFTIPTVEQVAEYCRERGNAVDANTFVDYYASKGWRVGNQSMKDWQACVRTWERREASTPHGTGQQPQQRRGLDPEVMEAFLRGGDNDAK